MSNEEHVARQHQINEQKMALQREEEFYSSVVHENNLRIFDQLLEQEAMPYTDLSAEMLATLTDDVSYRELNRLNTIIVKYLGLGDAQQRHFSALYRTWSARGFDWLARQCEPSFVQKVSQLLSLSDWTLEKECKICCNTPSRPGLGWRVSGGRNGYMNAARLLAAVIHGWSAIQDNEASHLCHTNTCLDERHVVVESVLLNAERERCRKGWQVCTHILSCSNCAPLDREVLEEIADLLDDDDDDDDDTRGGDPDDGDSDDDDDHDDDDRGNDMAPMRVYARDHDDIKLDDKLLTIDKNEFRSAGSKRITTKRFRCRNAECSGAASYYPLLDVFQTRHHEKCEHKKPSRAPFSTQKDMTTKLDEAISIAVEECKSVKRKKGERKKDERKQRAKRNETPSDATVEASEPPKKKKSA